MCPCILDRRCIRPDLGSLLTLHDHQDKHIDTVTCCSSSVFVICMPLLGWLEPSDLLVTRRASCISRLPSKQAQNIFACRARSLWPQATSHTVSTTHDRSSKAKLISNQDPIALNPHKNASCKPQRSHTISLLHNSPSEIESKCETPAETRNSEAFRA